MPALLRKVGIPLLFVVLLAFAARSRPGSTAQSPRRQIPAAGPAEAESPLPPLAAPPPIPLVAASSPAVVTTPAPDPAQGSATEGEGEDVEHPYFEKAAAIQGWEEFYRWANRTYGNPELFARLTLHRLSGEIGLSKDQVKTVLRTLRAEREAAERAVLQAYDKEKLKLIFECPDEDQAAYGEIWKGLGGILDRVHRDSGAALESGFTPEQRAAIDEHLRNQNLGLCHEYNRDSFGRNLGGDRFWVVGVGRVRGGRGFAGPSEQETEIEVLALPAVFRR